MGQPQDKSDLRTKRKKDNSQTVEQDVNHAIDAIMEFNDAQERPHQQKFYIGVGSVRELSGRGDVAIRRILKNRSPQIEQHLAKHELDISQNHSRKDDLGHEYPTIDREDEINYHKITQVT